VTGEHAKGAHAQRLGDPRPETTGRDGCPAEARSARQEALRAFRELKNHDGQTLPRPNLNHDPCLSLEGHLVALHEWVREVVVIDHRSLTGLGADEHRELGHRRHADRWQYVRLDPGGLLLLGRAPLASFRQTLLDRPASRCLDQLAEHRHLRVSTVVAPHELVDVALKPLVRDGVMRPSHPRLMMLLTASDRHLSTHRGTGSPCHHRDQLEAAFAASSWEDQPFALQPNRAVSPSKGYLPT
jgi:hypothetical protein